MIDDTGPPYPLPATAAAGIGSFIIGVTPIGNVSPFDTWTTVIAQYSNSPILDSLINSFDAAMDLTQLMDEFFNLIFNIQTAVGYGLDVIGRIVGISRTVPIPSASAVYLGFEEASSWVGFGQGGFYSGGGVSTNFVLSDDDYRLLIYAKMAGNISDGSIPSVNEILLTLFAGRGTCYVADGLNMSLTYTFTFALNPVEIAIVLESGVLPSAAGVVINISHP
jgi:hypothetical protein